MHLILVIILLLTICLCDKYLLHNSILYIINNVLALTTDAPVSKHQRKLVSQLKVKLNPAKFSKTHVFRVKIFDSTAGPINQSQVM